MHDIGRTQLEHEQEAFEFEQENEQFLGAIAGSLLGGLGGGGRKGRRKGGLGGLLGEQQEMEFRARRRRRRRRRRGFGGLLDEPEEMEFAARLLEVGNEQEFEQFLGDVFRTVGHAAGRFIRSDTGQALGGILKDAAGRALPVIGSGIGNWVAPGGAGAQWGGRIGSAAGSLLGLELEGLSGEDREFETARQFVRFATTAAHRAALAPPNVSPEAAARTAAMAAAQHFAPGLVQEIGRHGYRSRSGYRPYRGSSGYRRYGRTRPYAWRGRSPYAGRPGWSSYRRYGRYGSPRLGWGVRYRGQGWPRYRTAIGRPRWSGLSLGAAGVYRPWWSTLAAPPVAAAPRIGVPRRYWWAAPYPAVPVEQPPEDTGEPPAAQPIEPADAAADAGPSQNGQPLQQNGQPDAGGGDAGEFFF